MERGVACVFQRRCGARDATHNDLAVPVSDLAVVICLCGTDGLFASLHEDVSSCASRLKEGLIPIERSRQAQQWEAVMHVRSISVNTSSLSS